MLYNVIFPVHNFQLVIKTLLTLNLCYDEVFINF